MWQVDHGLTITCRAKREHQLLPRKIQTCQCRVPKFSKTSYVKRIQFRNLMSVLVNIHCTWHGTKLDGLYTERTILRLCLFHYYNRSHYNEGGRRWLLFTSFKTTLETRSQNIVCMGMDYCISRNFREAFIFANFANKFTNAKIKARKMSHDHLHSWPTFEIRENNCTWKYRLILYSIRNV